MSFFHVILLKVFFFTLLLFPLYNISDGKQIRNACKYHKDNLSYYENNSEDLNIKSTKLF